MSWNLIKEVFEFVKNPQNFHILLLILSPLTFYLVKKEGFFIFSLVISFIMLVYRLDLNYKIKQIKENRIKSKRKRKVPLKKFKLIWKKADEEFKGYLFCWPFFGLISILFIGSYVYSSVISYNFSKLLFGLHLGLGAFFILLSLILNKNFALLAKRRIK